MSVQKASKENPVQFYFLTKFYHKDVSGEVIQDNIEAVFFSREIYCHLEMVVLLGSHTL